MKRETFPVKGLLAGFFLGLLEKHQGALLLNPVRRTHAGGVPITAEMIADLEAHPVEIRVRWIEAEKDQKKFFKMVKAMEEKAALRSGKEERR